MMMVRRCCLIVLVLSVLNGFSAQIKAEEMLGKAREVARSIKCISNLKQIGLALRMYTADWDGWFPANRYAANHTEWTAILVNNGYITGSSVVTWTAPAGVWKCPSEEYAGTRNAAGYPWLGTHYGLNWYLSFKNDDPSNTYYNWKKIGQIRDPSGTYMVGDASASSAVRLMPNNWASSGAAKKRHTNNTVWNVCYVDGHVEGLKETTDRKDPAWANY